MPRPTKPIAQRSEKRVSEQDVRATLAFPWLGTYCWLRLDGCAGIGTHWHELVGAGVGGSRTDARNIAWTCWPCNSGLERLPSRYERGLKVRTAEAMPGDGGLVPREPSPYALAERWT